MSASVRSNVSCAFCSRCAHLDRQIVDGADGFGLAGVDGVAQQLGAAGKLLRQFRQALAQRRGARAAAAAAPCRCRSLSARSVITGMVFSMVSVLRRASSAEARGQREIIGVGGDQHRGEGLAGFSERGPDQGVAVPGGALDDRIEPGHVARRGQHLVLIGFRNGGLDAAQFAEAVEEALGDAFELLHRSRQHRVGRGARGEGAEHGLAQQQDLGEQLGARLVDVAMDQVLQPAGFALQQRQNLVGFPHLPHVVPGRTEHLGAVPDHARPAPRRPPSSARRSTGCASGSAPRAAARRGWRGPARQGPPAVPQHRPAGGLLPRPTHFTLVRLRPMAARKSRAAAAVEIAVQNSATAMVTVRERSARLYTGTIPL